MLYICIAIYLLSIAGARKWVKQQYEIVWTSISPGGVDIFMTFVPLDNTILAAWWLVRRITGTGEINAKKYFGLH